MLVGLVIGGEVIVDVVVVVIGSSWRQLVGAVSEAATLVALGLISIGLLGADEGAIPCDVACG